MTATRLAVLDMPEGNAMRAPGDAPGSMAMEIAIDEMAEKLRLDPIDSAFSMTPRSILKTLAGLFRSAISSRACALEQIASAGAGVARSPPRLGMGAG